jgi:uncharacterized membrane protein
MKRLANYFFQGLVYLAPIAITVWIFVATFQAIDGLLRLPIPGAGVLILVVFTTSFGFLLSNFLAKRLLTWFEDIMDRLPFAKLMHGSLKDLMSAFVGEKRRFKHPVTVEMIPGSGVRVFGFVTRETMDDFGIADSVGVYLPQAYNFAGQLVIVPRKQVKSIDGAESADVMTMIVSGGVSAGHSRTELPAQK